jgi:hypothetical protein
LASGRAVHQTGIQAAVPYNGMLAVNLMVVKSIFGRPWQL